MWCHEDIQVRMVDSFNGQSVTDAIFPDKRVERVSKEFLHPPHQFRQKVPTKTKSRPFSSAQDTHWTSLQVSKLFSPFFPPSLNPTIVASRPTKVWRTATKLGIGAARQRLRSVLRKDSKRHVRR